MMNLTSLWTIAGKPAMPGNGVGRCRVCGLDSVGLSFDDWVRPTFTDHDKLQPGDIICYACQFLFVESSELLRQKTGKDKPQRMRNYSHIVKADEWHPLSKGEKAQMKELIFGYPAPVFIVLAESGQKHILFRARWNVPYTTSPYVQFEEHGGRIMLATLANLLTKIEPMLTIFAKAEIEGGQYSQNRILKFGMMKWQRSEETFKQYRDSLEFSIALFLAQKEETNDGDASEDSGIVDDSVARSAEGLQTPLSAQHLGAVRGKHPERGVHQQSEQVHQLAFFEDGGDHRRK